MWYSVSVSWLALGGIPWRYHVAMINAAMRAALASWFNAFEAASNTMASDKTDSDEVRRSLAMTLINVACGKMEYFAVLQRNPAATYPSWRFCYPFISSMPNAMCV